VLTNLAGPEVHFKGPETESHRGRFRLAHRNGLAALE
jgi:hypothetical protein